MTKQQIIEKSIAAYGHNYKSPLARALGVSVSTVRRWFNQTGVNQRAMLAIFKACEEKLENDNDKPA